MHIKFQIEFNRNTSYMYSRSKKEKAKRNITIYFNTNCDTEMKLVPPMDYCLLQFDALKFFFGLPLHGGSLPNFNFCQCKLPNFSPHKLPRNRFSQHF